MSKIRNPLHLEVVPSPGTQITTWQEMSKRLESILPFVESVHIDIVDGKFAPNNNLLDPSLFAKYTSQAKFEVHLMTEDPLQYLESFAKAGFVRFIGQIEKMPDMVGFVAKAQEYGEAGLAIDGPTPLEKLQVDLEDLDVAFFYTGEKAGFSGATMLLDRLEKVKKLREKDPFIPIEIDGGVNEKNILLAKEAGVTRFVSTGYIYNGNSQEQLDKLKKLVF